jgi:transcriptional regulator with XRE-family HTH domain
MSAYVSPVVRRRQLARRLKEQRVLHELSVEDVAGRVGFSPAKLSRLELADRGPQLEDIDALAAVYGLTEAERDEWMSLARDARRKGWWQNYRYIRADTARYFGLEDAACRIRWFEASRMPGLLQSPDYARASVQEYVRGLDIPQDVIDAQGDVPQRRAARLTVEPLVQLTVVVDEAVISRRVGSSAIMAAQLDHMLALSRRPNVDLRVVPFSAGFYPGLEGSFTILDFDEDLEMPSCVWVEGHVGTFLLDKPADLQRYEELWITISGVACTAAASSTTVRRVAGRWRVDPDGSP